MRVHVATVSDDSMNTKYKAKKAVEYNLKGIQYANKTDTLKIWDTEIKNKKSCIANVKGKRRAVPSGTCICDAAN